MKRKAVIEKNIAMIKTVKNIAKKENDNDLEYWALGVLQSLSWIIDNSDNSDISLALCTSIQEQEVIENIIN